MSETEESKPQEYEMKEIKIAVYLNQRKDFAWVPAAQTCGSEEKVRTILDAIDRSRLSSSLGRI
jgi:hypothetical protein